MPKTTLLNFILNFVNDLEINYIEDYIEGKTQFYF